MDTTLKKREEKIKSLIINKKYLELKNILKEYLAPDIMETIGTLDIDEKVILFRLLNKQAAAEVFSLLEHEDQENLLKYFGMDRIKEIIEEMNPDDRTELLDELPDEMVKRLLRLLSNEERSIANRLLNYPEDSAGRLMTPEFIELKKDISAQRALDIIRKTGINKETIYYSYVVDENRMLIGIVSLKDLLLSDPDIIIDKIMTTNIVCVNTTDDQEIVANILTKYDLNAIPVVDKDNKLVGIITVDDVVDVIHEEATEDFQKMSGIVATDESYFNTKLLVLGKKRVIWLIILLFTSYLSSVVIKHYSDVLQIIIPLAFFIPMLTDTCGNTGMQSTTLIIRGFATGEIILKDFIRVLSREIFTGLFLGIILGVLSFVRAYFVDINPLVGITVGIAVFVSVIGANIIGVIIPMILKRLKLDPAISAGPFISTIIDVIVLVIYFEIAQTIFHIS